MDLQAALPDILRVDVLAICKTNDSMENVFYALLWYWHRGQFIPNAAGWKVLMVSACNCLRHRQKNWIWCKHLLAVKMSLW